MRTQMHNQNLLHYYRLVCITLIILFSITRANANPTLQISKKGDVDSFIEYKAIVVDSKNGTVLSYANIMVVGTNISTVTNSEGEFSLKISKEIQNPTILVSYIGYKNKQLSVTNLNGEKVRIEMEVTSVVLPEIKVISKDAEALILAVLKKKGDNYINKTALMTAFYREAIKKNRNYVSLSEAVVEINKQSYTSYRDDIVKIYKSRKQADYSKLDTITFKLQGGPFNSLHLDVMKNPDLVFSEDMMNNYQFSYDRSTYMDNQLIYVLDFKQRLNKAEPFYYGKLYIVAESLALKTAVFKLNISDREEAASMFIIKKPFFANVYPIETNYRIDYREKNGKWYYGYSRIEFGLKVNWKRKLFNTTYFSTIEMAVTDWEILKENTAINSKERLRSSVIIADEASGFSEPEFWGEYNVIEPEKSIETAIQKIQKQLEKK